MNVRLYLVFLISLFLSSFSVVAGQKHYSTRFDDRYSNHNELSTYVDKAKVISVKPVYEEYRISQPDHYCYEEPVEYHYSTDPQGVAGAIAGGAVGGVLGHQVDRGSGRDVATVVGSVLGAMVGHDIASDPRRHHRQYYEQRCDTTYQYDTRRELLGYDVKYRYRGQTLWARMPERPHSYIDVHVTIEPMIYYE